MGRLGIALPRDGRLTRLLVGAFLAADVAVAAVALAVHDSGSGATNGNAAPTRGADTSAPSAGPTSSAALPASALAWMSETLPHTAAVLSDGTVRAELVSKGFSSAGQPARPRYTVSTPTLRRQASDQPAIAASLRAAVPIAVFTTSTGPLVVGEVVGVPATTVDLHRTADAQLRLGAGQALVRNPTFTAAPLARSVLVAGRLDLRAATALALMAANGRTELQSVTSVGAEQRAGLPSRTITFRATPEPQQRALLLGLAQAYRPQTWTQLPDGSYRATWPIRADPDNA